MEKEDQQGPTFLGLEPPEPGLTSASHTAGGRWYHPGGDYAAELDVSERNLEEVPAGTLPHHLTALRLTGNRLAALPEDLASLDSLETLYAGANRLADARLAFGRPELLHAGLSYNRIGLLRPEDVNCRRLLSLDLAHNQLCSIGATLKFLAELPKLRSLTLAGNPLCLLKGYPRVLVEALPHLAVLDQRPVARAPGTAGVEPDVDRIGVRIEVRELALPAPAPAAEAEPAAEGEGAAEARPDPPAYHLDLALPNGATVTLARPFGPAGGEEPAADPKKKGEKEEPPAPDAEAGLRVHHMDLPVLAARDVCRDGIRGTLFVTETRELLEYSLEPKPAPEAEEGEEEAPAEAPEGDGGEAAAEAEEKPVELVEKVTRTYVRECRRASTVWFAFPDLLAGGAGAGECSVDLGPLPQMLAETGQFMAIDDPAQPQEPIGKCVVALALHVEAPQAAAEEEEEGAGEGAGA